MEKVTLGAEDVGRLDAADLVESKAKPAPKPREVISVGDRKYYKLENGDLREVDDPAAHSKRLLDSIVNRRLTITGLRLTDPELDHAEGVVVTLTESEASSVVEAVKAALTARVKEAETK